MLNNLLLTTGCATVFIGTLYPLALESLTGAKISVGPPYFNLTFVPLMVPLLLAMPFGPYLAWKRGDLPGATAAPARGGARWRSLGLVVALRAVSGAGRGWRRSASRSASGSSPARVSEWATRVKLFARRRATRVWRRARGLPRSAYGATLAHAGIGLTVLGIVATIGLAERARRRHEARRAARRSPATSSPSAASPRRRGPTIRSRSASSP